MKAKPRSKYGRVNVRRLVRLYGPETASEVLRKVVIACARSGARREPQNQVAGAFRQPR